MCLSVNLSFKVVHLLIEQKSRNFAVQNLGLTSLSWTDLMSYMKNYIQGEHLLAFRKALIIY